MNVRGNLRLMTNVTVMAMSMLLAACALPSNHHENKDPVFPDSKRISIEVVGLSGHMTLAYQGTGQLVITHDGVWEIPYDYDIGDSFTINIIETPPQQTCTLSKSSGILSASTEVVSASLTFIPITTPLSGKRIFLMPSNATYLVTGTSTQASVFTLSYAEKVKPLLEKCGASVRIMEGSYSLNPNPWVQDANAWNADLILGIAFNTGGGHGTETYYAPGTPSDLLAQKLNAQVIQAASLANRGVKTNSALFPGAVAPSAACFVCFSDCTQSHTTTYGSISESLAIRQTKFSDAIAIAYRDTIFDFFLAESGHYPPEAPESVFASSIGSDVTISWTRAGDDASNDGDLTYFLIDVKKDGGLFGSGPWSTKASQYVLPDLPEGFYEFSVRTVHKHTGDSPVTSTNIAIP